MGAAAKPDRGDRDTLDPLIGLVLQGTWRIARSIGRGGLGVVYEATHERLPKKAAVKVLRRELADHAEAFERFRREAEIACSIGAASIAEVYDLNFLPDGSPYIAMELLDGEDLSVRLAARGRLSLAEALEICGQIVEALEATHRRGIIHRDLKPQNVFLCRVPDAPFGGLGDRVKLLDFGISKIVGSVTNLTDSGVVMGTPHHMSPEQARGDTQLIDHRTDVYALGILLYQVLSGELPFHAESPYAVLLKIVNEPAPTLRSRVPELPAALDAVLARALAKNPGERYPSAALLWDDLLAAVEQPFRPPGQRALRSGEAALAPTALAAPTPVGGKPGAVLAASDPFRAPLSPASSPGSPMLAPLPRVPHPPAEVPARSGKALALVGAGLLAAAIAGFVLLSRRAGPDAAPPPAPVAAAPEPAAVKAPARARVVLVLEPPEARALVDGRPAPGRTLELDAGSVHQLSVRADGFSPHDGSFTATSGELRVSLAPLPRPQKRARPAAKPSARLPEPGTNRQPEPSPRREPKGPALMGSEEL